VDEALPIAKQIAEALEAAHEAGVIHRDLEPANIKVREDGTVKVLDFGLAKALQPEVADPRMSLSPTISLTAAATQMGMVIGTAAYMAPEQARGKPVDKRADIWAFGAVLFEMLAGVKPFAGADVSEVLATVIKTDPAWDALGDETASRVRTLLRRCLEKDPKQRVADMQDVRLAMEGAFDAAGGGPLEDGGLEPLSESLEPVSKRLGSHAELLRIRGMMCSGPSYARQRQVYADTGDYTQVVDSVVRELRDSVPAGRPGSATT
jgi:serine/threonine protein kinase